MELTTIEQEKERLRIKYLSEIKDMFALPPGQEELDTIIEDAVAFIGESKIEDFKRLSKTKQFNIITMLNSINLR
jgi:hypothetical protein